MIYKDTYHIIKGTNYLDIKNTVKDKAASHDLHPLCLLINTKNIDQVLDYKNIVHNDHGISSPKGILLKTRFAVDSYTQSDARLQG